MGPLLHFYVNKCNLFSRKSVSPFEGHRTHCKLHIYKRSKFGVNLHKGYSWACTRRDPDDTSNHVGGHRDTDALECNAKTITGRIQLYLNDLDA